jgi:hypothetical protein
MTPLGKYLFLFTLFLFSTSVGRTQSEFADDSCGIYEQTGHWIYLSGETKNCIVLKTEAENNDYSEDSLLEMEKDTDLSVLDRIYLYFLCARKEIKSNELTFPTELKFKTANFDVITGLPDIRSFYSYVYTNRKRYWTELR